MPRISTIIPTTQRPELLLRAIGSVLAQTMADIEIIVVVDGHNPETIALLKNTVDRRLRVIQNEVPSGPGGARNVGVAAAQGPWVAFLDDDDEWLPSKLEKQLAAAERAGHPVVVSCLSQVVTPLARYVWPRRIYDSVIPFDEYLFDRRSLFKGETYFPTPSLFMSRELFDFHQFPLLRQYEDLDFLLRVVKMGNTRVITIPEPLVIVYAEEEQGRESLSGSHSWRSSLAWIDNTRPLVGRRAYSGFCLTWAGPQAALAKDYSAFPTLLYRAFRHGSPRLIQLAAYLAAWLIPMRLRRQVRSWLPRNCDLDRRQSAGAESAQLSKRSQ